MTLDKFDALGDWVEKGKAPDEIVATVDPANKDVPASWSPSSNASAVPVAAIWRATRAAIRRAERPSNARRCEAVPSIRGASLAAQAFRHPNRDSLGGSEAGARLARHRPPIRSTPDP